MFSRRSSFDRSPNPMALALDRASSSPRRRFDLTEANPTRVGLATTSSALLAALASPAALDYEPSPLGLRSAREAVSRELAIHGVSVTPETLMLTASTSEAYSFIFKLLCDPGDEVLVPRPSYPLFEHLARLESVRATAYRYAYDGAWHVDAGSVLAGVTPRTRAIVSVSPNNPTGSFLKQRELAELASLGVPIISDEVFAPYALRPDPSRAGSAMNAAGTAPLIFVLGGLSKLAGLPQLKLAWTSVGGSAVQVAEAMARLEIIADAFLSVGTPVQLALPTLLEAGRTRQRAIADRTQRNLAWLVDTVRDQPLSVLDLEGGWYATLRLPSTRSEEEWALDLLEHEGVYTHPGHFFDFESEPYLVVSLLTPEAEFREGVTRIVDRVRRG